MAKKQFVIEQSRLIPAPAERILSHLRDFHQWVHWSPWEKLDADLQRTYSGPDSGVGATYSWSGKKAGAGTMQIVGVKPEEVAIKLSFTKPFKAENDTFFLLAPAEQGTKVTWRMQGTQSAIGKIFYKIFNVEAGINKDFAEGLANLEKVAVE